MSHWSEQALLYHVFPLGALGAPYQNPGGPPVSRLLSFSDWIDPVAETGADTLLLGPLWESGSHGYDTYDYTTLDRRLGTNDDLTKVLQQWKARGFRLVFDAVFNHSGRQFFAFADLLKNGPDSPYVNWYKGVDFTRQSPFGDPFTYQAWNNYYKLAKYNLKNPQVKAYLFGVVKTWIETWDADGLRLDAADVMDKVFLRELGEYCRRLKPDFWLLGEVVHGDYRQWAPGAGLDSVTNYELYKALWSCHNTGNYHELAHSLNRQFGPEGLYRGLHLSTFGDNHDVSRLASQLHNPAHLYPHALLTATVPGLPTIYYGSEGGLAGKKAPTSDQPLRPALQARDLYHLPHPPLRELWGRLAHLRRQEAALRTGHYLEAWVSPRQFAFWRLPRHEGRPVLVAVNADQQPAVLDVTVPPGLSERPWEDLLNPGQVYDSTAGRIKGVLWPTWGALLVPR